MRVLLGRLLRVDAAIEASPDYTNNPAASPLSGCILGPMATRIAGFRGEFLSELEIAERQVVAIAECIPAE